MSPEGFTNPRDALSEAFGKLKPSTIWLLSDGKFSQFKRVKRGNRTQVVGLPPVYKVIQKLNPTGAVRVNTIGFADSEQDVDDSLKAIAKENDGTTVSLNPMNGSPSCHRAPLPDNVQMIRLALLVFVSFLIPFHKPPKAGSSRC